MFTGKIISKTRQINLNVSILIQSINSDNNWVMIIDLTNTYTVVLTFDRYLLVRSQYTQNRPPRFTCFVVLSNEGRVWISGEVIGRVYY